MACGMNTLYGLLRSEMEGYEKRMLGKINGTTKQWMHCWRGLAELSHYYSISVQNPTCKERLMVAWSVACISAEIQL